MEFRIADTFTKALTRLNKQEQKQVKTKVFDLQLDPSGNSLRMHRLDRGRDKNFWSVSVNMDVRIIVHRQSNSLLLCYVDHHDKAYQWAENRKLEVHPKTGAAQLVELVETIREVEVPVEIPVEVPQSPVFPLRQYEDEQLLRYGVPEEWLERLQQASEDELLELTDHLPGEAAEAVLDLATGTIPPEPALPAEGTDPFDHPDALRRFRIIDTGEELRAALDYPWDQWTIFLHPAQRAIVEKHFNGPARVSGSAGTGKTVVALHRAVHLARTHQSSRVLLTTFSDALANALKAKRNQLVRPEPYLAEQIEVYSLDAVGQKLYRARGGDGQLIDQSIQRDRVLQAAKEVDHSFSDHFLFREWRDVVDPWQLRTWEDYRDVRRLGRSTRLSEAKRKILWRIYQNVYEQLEEDGLITRAGIFQALAGLFGAGDQRTPFDFIVVDEAQDISVPQLRFLAALAGEKPNGLFFAGDLGQRIFQAPFSWESLGVKVRGRSSTLRVNYRTSHQIRQKADLLLNPEIADVDGNRETRKAQSVFNGPPPVLYQATDETDEIQKASQWIQARIQDDGVEPEELAVFVRSQAQLDRARRAIRLADQSFCELDEHLNTRTGSVTLSTMHLAKGLEFKAVAVIACDQEVIPDASRLEAAHDMSDIEEVFETERHLLYVACTRARDHLWVSSAGDPSEFLGDMG